MDGINNQGVYTQGMYSTTGHNSGCFLNIEKIEAKYIKEYQKWIMFYGAIKNEK